MQLAENTCVHKKVYSHESSSDFSVRDCFVMIENVSDLFLLKMCSVPCENGHGLRYQS